MSILVIATGGTIGAVAHNKLEHPDKIQMMPPTDIDPVRDALAGGFAHFFTRYIAVEHRDSNLIDDAYRTTLLELVGQALETHILITHGTDTLLQTAEFIFEHQKRNVRLGQKVIVLTGALVPLANGAESDGHMNLGFSLEQLTRSNLAAGIYIVLCDYVKPEIKEGWAPRLYAFSPRLYEKYYDPENARRSHLRKIV